MGGTMDYGESENIHYYKVKCKKLEAKLAKVKDELIVTRRILDAIMNIEDKDHILQFAPILGLWRIVCKIREAQRKEPQ